MGKSNFAALLKLYGSVIVKPSHGSGGAGVMSISSKKNGAYGVHYGKSRTTIAGLSSTYSFVRRKAGSSSHIVQRKISLAKVGGRPFDVRVMIQRRKNEGWRVTGKLAKIAGPGYIVTNVARSKGRVAPLSTAIRQSNIRGASSGRIESRIDRMALRSAKRLQQHYGVRTVGLDVGIDTGGKPWIIEANFHPAKSLFRKLKDKSAYRRIMSYR